MQVVTLPPDKPPKPPKPDNKPPDPGEEIPDNPEAVYYCPRSCREGRVYSTKLSVVLHVEAQHPDHDPRWWVG